jgi:F0F1-type ATP synthase membrane subunit b/b'
MPTSDEARRVLGRFLGALVQVGNRAMGAAIKSAAKDVKREIKKAERKVQEIADIVDEVAPQVADDGDESEIVVEMAGAKKKVRKR